MKAHERVYITVLVRLLVMCVNIYQVHINIKYAIIVYIPTPSQPTRTASSHYCCSLYSAPSMYVLLSEPLSDSEPVPAPSFPKQRTMSLSGTQPPALSPTRAHSTTSTGPSEVSCSPVCDAETSPLFLSTLQLCSRCRVRVLCGRVCAARVADKSQDARRASSNCAFHSFRHAALSKNNLSCLVGDCRSVRRVGR